MHFPFYASGFLYSPKTYQILLLQSKQKADIKPVWSMLGGESINEEEAQITFQRIVNKLLGLNLKPKDICPVYDYFHDVRNQVNYVFYAEVKNSPEFDPFEGDIFSWVALDETAKLSFTACTKQDVIVGERVINAKWRDNQAKKLLTL